MKPSLKHFTFALIFSLSTGFTGFAQENTNASTDVPASPSFKLILQHTTLVVSNFEVSKKFYTEILQLEEITTNFLPENQMFLSLGNNLELHVGEVEGVEITPSNFNHFAVSVANFDAFLEYLKSHNIVYGGLGGGQEYFVQNRPDGVRQTWIQDPDGYWIEFNDMKDN